MPQRALIIGCSGFAGSFLCEHLLACGDAVLGCTKDGGWLDSSPAELAGRVPVVGWDLQAAERPPGETRRTIEDFRPTVVYHLAAISIPKDCGHEEPTPAAVAINVEGTRRVVRLTAELPGRPRLFFTSSSKVYRPVTPEAPVVDEQSPVGPAGAYGKTKLDAEAAVLRGVNELGVDAVISRSFQHTGPRQNPSMMLPQWARQFAVGGDGPIEVFTRDAVFDFSDVRDTVRAYRLLAERGASGGIYNVGSGVPCRSGDVLAVLQRLAGSHRPIVELHPEPKQEAIADISRLASETGWRATIRLERTVADTLAWWQDRLQRS